MCVAGLKPRSHGDPAEPAPRPKPCSAPHPAPWALPRGPPSSPASPAARTPPTAGSSSWPRPAAAGPGPARRCWDSRLRRPRGRRSGLGTGWERSCRRRSPRCCRGRRSSLSVEELASACSSLGLLGIPPASSGDPSPAPRQGPLCHHSPEELCCGGRGAQTLVPEPYPHLGPGGPHRVSGYVSDIY